MQRTRLALGVAGIALGLFGVFRLVTEISSSDLFVLVVWLAGAVLIHDGILSPIIVGVGAALNHVPARARQFLQAALIAGALVTVIALPLIYREGTLPASKAILQRNYTGSLFVILAAITVVAAVTYLLRVLHDRRTPPATRRPRPGPRPRPAPDQPTPDRSAPDRRAPGPTAS